MCRCDTCTAEHIRGNNSSPQQGGIYRRGRGERMVCLLRYVRRPNARDGGERLNRTRRGKQTRRGARKASLCVKSSEKSLNSIFVVLYDSGERQVSSPTAVGSRRCEKAFSRHELSWLVWTKSCYRHCAQGVTARLPGVGWAPMQPTPRKRLQFGKNEKRLPVEVDTGPVLWYLEVSKSCSQSQGQVGKRL